MREHVLETLSCIQRYIEVLMLAKTWAQAGVVLKGKPKMAMDEALAGLTDEVFRLRAQRLSSSEPHAWLLGFMQQEGYVRAENGYRDAIEDYEDGLVRISDLALDIIDPNHVQMVRESKSVDTVRELLKLLEERSGHQSLPKVVEPKEPQDPLDPGQCAICRTGQVSTEFVQELGHSVCKCDACETEFCTTCSGRTGTPDGLSSVYNIEVVRPCRCE